MPGIVLIVIPLTCRRLLGAAHPPRPRHHRCLDANSKPSREEAAFRDEPLVYLAGRSVRNSLDAATHHKGRARRIDRICPGLGDVAANWDSITVLNHNMPNFRPPHKHWQLDKLAGVRDCKRPLVSQQMEHG